MKKLLRKRPVTEFATLRLLNKTVGNPMSPSSQAVQTLARKIDLYISAIVLMAVEQSIKEGHHPAFRVGPGVFLERHVEEKFKFQFYEANTLLSQFWDVRGLFSNTLMLEAHHPLRFHFVKAEHPMGRLFVLKDLHDLGDCHAYYLDRSKRMRPLSYRDSTNAPSIEELASMANSIKSHAIKLGCSPSV
jgi:hypothetical protein